MYSLEQIFIQAVQDTNSSPIVYPNYESQISCGIKIVKDNKSGDINIFNTTRGGDFYREINNTQYKTFKKNGWLRGLYTLALNNFCRKLETIEEKIKNEFNNNKNLKHIQRLKSARERILIRYNKVSNQLKTLNND